MRRSPSPSFRREEKKILNLLKDYERKKAEWDAKKREEAAHREYRRRSKLRKQEFWAGVMTEFKQMKDEVYAMKTAYLSFFSFSFSHAFPSCLLFPLPPPPFFFF